MRPPIIPVPRDRAEQRASFDADGVRPSLQCPHGAGLRIQSVRDANLAALASLVRLRASERHDQAVACELHVLCIQRYELGSPERTGEADGQGHAVGGSIMPGRRFATLGANFDQHGRFDVLRRPNGSPDAARDRSNGTVAHRSRRLQTDSLVSSRNCSHAAGDRCGQWLSEEFADVLGSSPAIVWKHYTKWSTARQAPNRCTDGPRPGSEATTRGGEEGGMMSPDAALFSGHDLASRNLSAPKSLNHY